MTGNSAPSRTACGKHERPLRFVLVVRGAIFQVSAPRSKARIDFPGEREKPTVRHHTMIRTNAAPLDVPGPEQGFEGLNHGKHGDAMKGFYGLHDLGDGRHVAEVDATRAQGGGGVGYHTPGFREVENEAIQFRLLNSFIHIFLSNSQITARSQISLDVLHRCLSKVFPGFIAEDMAPVSHGPQQRHG